MTALVVLVLNEVFVKSKTPRENGKAFDCAKATKGEYHISRPKGAVSYKVRTSELNRAQFL